MLGVRRRGEFEEGRGGDQAALFGFEVATFVRNNERLKNTPIIMITSRSGEKHRERARLIGVNRYVIKPYQEDLLLAEVRAVLKGGAA